MKKHYFLLVPVFLLLFSCRGGAQVTMNTRIVKDGLFIPWELIYGPDGNIWLTQKNGYICRLHPTTGVLDTLYREAAVVVRSEGGMTGMALHPDFPAQPYVYAAHNYLENNIYKVRVMRYTYNGSNALGSPQLILDGINGNYNHNGCRLLFVGDKLFITTGDAQSQADAQNIQSPNGKVLRLNADGTIPADNPLPGSPLWSWGHRNAQGVVYANGRLYSSEHGPASDDEVNIIQKGRNFGWPTVNGLCDQPSEMTFCSDSNVVQPLKVWTPTIAPCGLDYYNQPMFPALQGSLLMTTLKDQHLYQLQLNTAGDAIINSTIVTAVSFGRLRDLCVSPAGRIYLSTSNSASSGTGSPTDKIIELYDPNASGIPKPGSLSVRIFPNPVKELLFLEFDRDMQADFQLLDVRGKVISEGRLNGVSSWILVAQLPAGQYLLQVLGVDGGKAEHSFIKVE